MFKLPDWFSSVRSLVTLLLTGGFIVLIHRFVSMILDPNFSKDALVVISSLVTSYTSIYILTLNYYFKDKKRNEE